MKFSDLTLKNDFITHKVGEFEFKEKSFLNFDEEIEIVVSVINAVTAQTIVEGVINDLMIVDKYLLLFYVLIATDIEFTEEEVNNPKSIMETLVNNEVDKIFYNSENYNYLYSWIVSLLEEEQRRKNSIHGLIEDIVKMVPTILETLDIDLEELENKEEVKKIVSNLAA